MGEVIDENDLGRHIRYRPPDRLGPLVERGQPLDDRGHAHRHRRGRPLHGELPLDVPGLLPALARATRPSGTGMESFKGRIVHPQTWPEDLDYAGKKVVVIGSGATAATLVPAIADECDHVTHAAALADLFQDRPQRRRSRRHAAPVADRRELDPRDRAPQDPARSGGVHAPRVRGAGGREARSCWAACAPISARTTTWTRTSRRRYRPWRQRIAFVPDGDLFQGIRAGKASVVTDEIERFTETGIRLKSGKDLEADIIVTATGLQSQRAGRHRVHRSTASRSTSPTRSPIAA